MKDLYRKLLKSACLVGFEGISIVDRYPSVQPLHTFVVSSDDVHISCCQQLPDVLSELAWKRKRERERESKMCLRQRSWCHSHVWSERIREDPSPVMEA